MVIQKTYITWMEFILNRNYRAHPDDFVKISWDGYFWFESLSYTGNGIDKRHLGIVSWDDEKVNATLIEEFLRQASYFNFQQKTLAEVNTLLNTWYPVTQEDAEAFPSGSYFTLDVDGFTIIDNRPIDESL